MGTGTKKLLKNAVWMLVVVFAVIFVQPFGCGRSISLTSSSPNGAYRVEMVEYLGRMDRNFYLRLHRAGDKTTTTVFDSPDEGRPVGTERIIWARDSSQFVLVGRHFFVPETAHLTNGEAIYLLYEVKSGRLRCNGTSQATYPGLTGEDLKGINWDGDI